MNEQSPAEASGSSNRRLVIVISVGVLVVMAVLVGLFVVSIRPQPAQTPDALQQTAEAALLSPSRAPLDLNMNVTEWYPPNGSDYAIEGGMVIFPQPPQTNRINLIFEQAVQGDEIMAALVYAPNGGDLPSYSEIPYPTGRLFFLLTEWALFDCHPLNDSPDWWRCMLIVGGHI